MNRRDFLGLAVSIPTFSILLSRESRVEEGLTPSLQITLLDKDAKDIDGSQICVCRKSFDIIPNGIWDWGERYVNNEDIRFPDRDRDWGDIYGFKVADMKGKTVCKTRFVGQNVHHVSRRDSVLLAPGSFELNLPE